MKLPGSSGEHALQKRFGTRTRAEAFYASQMLDHLNERMRAFVTACEIVFIATADAKGNCDGSLRAGLPGFVLVLDAHHLALPEYRGNGVMASLGNLSENPHVGLFFVDFFRATIGLHVNGAASIVEHAAFLADPRLTDEQRAAARTEEARKLERWIRVEVEEAYIHCSKHIPRLARLDKTRHWGTDDPACKGGDFFDARASKRRG